MTTKDTYYSAMTGIKLYPTFEQARFIDRCIDGYRIVYNWALMTEYMQYEKFNSNTSDKSFLSFYEMCELYRNEFRPNNDFLKSLPDHSMLNAIKDMVKGYESFFRNKSIFNKPRLKDGNEYISSYRPRSDVMSFYFNDNYVRIEGLSYKETIETSYHTGEYFKDYIRYYNPIIFRNNRTGEYFLNYVVLKRKLSNYFVENNIPKSEPIGVDVNKHIMYACSNGLNIYSVDTTRVEKHLADINKQVSKDRIRFEEIKKENPDAVPSNNSIKRLEKRKKIYRHLYNIHKNTAYQGSLQIIRLNPAAIIIEDLDIKKIMSYKYIADDLQFYPLGQVQRILKEQANKYDIPIVYAPARFESSNYCSNCGAYKDSQGSKIFVCDCCGARIQRDTNAAINLRNWYLQSTGNLT
ncbi:MAG: transposase [Acholeplasmatales bacterium]|nr:transposase [Acholeplasmatales bacterium]